MRAWVVLLSLTLMACAAPRDAFETSGGEGFVFVDESYDLFPTRLYEGEVRRLQDLRVYLTQRGLCQDSFEVTDRREAVTAPKDFELKEFGAGTGKIFRVTYIGRCITATS